MKLPAEALRAQFSGKRVEKWQPTPIVTVFTVDYSSKLCLVSFTQNKLKCDIKDLKKLVLEKYDANADGKLSMDEVR
jgi:hypothetical protein